jgi:DNA-binding transcriptional LysR family regulator
LIHSVTRCDGSGKARPTWGLCLLDPDAEPELERVGAGQVDLWPVCAPHHPLAELPPPQPRRAFGPWVQVVLSERRGSDPTDRGVLSARTWRVSDIDTKAALIAGGVGWGSLPEDRAAAGIDRGTLSRLHPEPFHGGRETLRFSAIRRSGRAVGPGARWWLDRWAEEAR